MLAIGIEEETGLPQDLVQTSPLQTILDDVIGGQPWKKRSGREKEFRKLRLG